MSVILIIDDDKALCRSLEIQLGSHGHEVHSAHTASDGAAALAGCTPDLLLLDLKLPDRTGLDVLHDLEAHGHDFPVVMITGQQDTKATIEAMRSGAFDYLRKPFDFDSVLLVIEKAQRLKADRCKVVPALPPDAQHEGTCEIVGAHEKIVEVVKQIGLLSRSSVTVLVQGESGTGKELVARALHEASAHGKPFVAINCSAVVSTILESELFGHEKGAFTGADSRKTGKLEFAGEGTVLFDEIGDMPLELQAKILRVLQEREFERVGGLETIPFEARVIAATNHDLEALVEEGKFRQDLFYRLSVSRIEVPPLRERRGDIRLLVSHLIRRISRKLHRPIEAVEEEALRALESYDWPGNVRELENALTRAAALAKSPILAVDDLEFSFGSPKALPTGSSEIVSLQEAEKEHIHKALIATGWNITHTAKALRISPTTLRKKIAEFGLKDQATLHAPTSQ
ncbi:MAG: sigma-54-dependent Fis family transcriptional regulator [Planctomycetes bacterium]|nr:sigma-54-dependent Fis family transcriptional regulator [Planctomycetota bacterium]